MADEKTRLNLEAIRKHVYQLGVFNFQGNLGLNHLINVEAPALIDEIERLRSALAKADASVEDVGER